MKILILFTSIIILSWSLLKYKNIMNPCFIFTLFFSVCTLWGSMTLHGQNKASTFIYFLIWISIITYAISFCIGYGLKRMNCKPIEYENIEINKRIIYTLAIISILITSVQFSRAMELIMSGLSMSEVRWAYWGSNDILTSPFDDFLQSTINGGLMLSLMIIASMELFLNEKKDIKLFILVLINVIMRTFTNSGRLLIYDFIIIILFCYIFFKKIQKNNKNNHTTYIKKMKIYLITILVSGLMVNMLVSITSQRQSDITLLNAIYDDFTCFLPLMDHVINLLDFNGDITYGITSFRGIIIIINVILAFLGIGQITSANVINIYDVPFFYIGGGNYANAYVSYIFYFYLDGRILGVILGNIFFGVISARIYKNLVYSPSKKTLAYYLFLMYLIFRSMIRWQLSTGDVYIEILVLFIVYNYCCKSKSKLKRSSNG